MKKLSLLMAITACLIFASVGLSDQTVFIGWTPDPAGATIVTGQEIWHDPDTNVVGNEVAVWSGSPTANTASFNIVGNDLPNDVVWHRTLYVGGAANVDTSPVSPVNTSGASVIYIFQHSD